MVFKEQNKFCMDHFLSPCSPHPLLYILFHSISSSFPFCNSNTHPPSHSSNAFDTFLIKIRLVDWFSDINECDDDEIRQNCQYGCENTDGSYRCLEPPTTTTTTTTPPPPPASENEDDYEEEGDEDGEEEVEQPTKVTSTSAAPPAAAAAACPDGFRHDVNNVCIGE